MSSVSHVVEHNGAFSLYYKSEDEESLPFKILFYSCFIAEYAEVEPETLIWRKVIFFLNLRY